MTLRNLTLTVALVLSTCLAFAGCQKSESGDTAGAVAPRPSPQIETAPASATGGEALEAIGNLTDEDGNYVCPVSGKSIENPENHPYVNYEGKTYYLWCPNCEAKFTSDPTGYIEGTALKCSDCEGEEHEHAGPGGEDEAAPDAETVIGNAKNADGAYICPVMDNPIPDLDKAASTVHEGKTYYFCCPGCVDQFKADPEKYVAKVSLAE